MTDDKALVERPCTCHVDDAPSVCQKKYALNECRIEAQAAEIERLREAGDRLVVFVRHYPRCATARGRDYCNCDHDIVIKAWKEARAALGEGND